MKIHIDIDCTAEEARAFLGLPDLAPVQKRFMEDLEKRMGEAMHTVDPEAVMKAWMSQGLPMLSEWQKLWMGAGEGKRAEGGRGKGGGEKT